MSKSEMFGTNKIGAGGCDLYLGCDVLVAAAESNLAVIAQDRTYVVVSTSVTATGQMVSDTTTLFPRADELRSRIEWSGSRPENSFVDARAVTETTDISEYQYYNIFILGMYFRAVKLTLSPSNTSTELHLTER